MKASSWNETGSRAVATGIVLGHREVGPPTAARPQRPGDSHWPIFAEPAWVVGGSGLRRGVENAILSRESRGVIPYG